MPLTGVEFAAMLDHIGGVEARPRLAVGVSGGPDSMALVLLAAGWARERSGEVTALIVDHGLRPESAEEAETVAGWLGGRAIPHEILCWRGPKPTSGLQEAAREARYRLLAEWCRARGVLHLLVAHHHQDQAETHLIRRRAASGPDGLAAMSAVRELVGVRLLRPLLAVPKARLAALLDAEGQPFLRDPSNLSPNFERGRLRAAAQPGFDGELADQIQNYGARRVAREAALDRLLANAVALHPAGFAALDPAGLSDAEPELAERLLGRLAACIGVSRYPPRRVRLAGLRAGIVEQPERALTLGGCRFVPWRGQVLVLREAVAAEPPRSLAPGTAVLWDRRFAVVSPATAANGLTLGYLGQYRGPGIERDDDLLPRLVHPVLPALWDDRGLAAIPHLGWRRHGVAALPTLQFCAATPLTRASFTVV